MMFLIVEDDPLVREGLVEILSAEGYDCIAAANGDEALQRFESEQPDFVCLDIMMPKLSGYDVCRQIRAAGSKVPILFLSAKSEEIDRVLGLELGADDYLMKPFGARELVARVRAIVRRCLDDRVARDDQVFMFGDLEIAASELRARRSGAVIDLTSREVSMLQLLFKNQRKVVSRDLFFDVCWGYGHVPNSRTLDQHISRLRRKIEPDPSQPTLIVTVHGVGYRYDPDGSCD
jgi:DNA-binding response OmpR family regulator